MSGHDHAEIDARLDEAFRRLPDTDELRDLRDELRGGLIARADELVAAGSGPAAAAATAFAELGDIEELASEVVGQTPAPPRTSDAPESPGVRAQRLAALHRVRPNPAFVVRTVVLSIVGAAALAVVALTAFGVLATPAPLAAAIAVVLLAAPLGVVAGDGAHQETTAHFPVPGRRAACYGAAAFVGIAGLALSGLFIGDLGQVWLIAVGAPLVVAAIAWLSFLGATQTNRTKPWMREIQAGYQGSDRFSQDEAAAARFGIYTAVIFIAAIAVFLVLSFTIGFAWSWLALVAGVVVFFLVLARMLFPNDADTTATRSKGADND